MKSVRTRETKLEIPLPEGWHDVSFEKAFQIISTELKQIEILSLLSGVSIETLRKETDLETIYYLTNSLLFLKDLPIKKHPEFPKSVGLIGSEEKITLPYVKYYDKFDLGKCETGQVEDMKQVIVSAKIKEGQILESIQLIPKICAIYLQPIFNFEAYDYDKALKFSETIEKKLDFKTAYNMGNFFLMRLQGLTLGSKTKWPKLHTVKRKSKRVLGNLVQRSASILP